MNKDRLETLIPAILSDTREKRNKILKKAPVKNPGLRNFSYNFYLKIYDCRVVFVLRCDAMRWAQLKWSRLNLEEKQNEHNNQDGEGKAES